MDDSDDHRSPHLATATGQHRALAPECYASFDVVDPRSLLTPAQRRQLDAWLHAVTGALADTGVRGGSVRIRLVTDAEMAAAHAKYSGIEGTTDVLTFDMRDEVEGQAEDLPADPLDVDVWVCVDEARRQAAARNIELLREILLYCLHAVLHCLGHDDHDEEGFARMHAEEDRILEHIGVGRTFALDAGGGVP